MESATKEAETAIAPKAEIAKRASPRKEVVRFLVVGAINTVFGYAVYAFFLWTGMHFSLAALGSQILGTAFNYATYGRLVFRQKLTRWSLFYFIAQYATLYFVSITIIQVAELAGVAPLIGGAINLMVVPVLTYFLGKYIVFRKRDD